MAVNGDEVVRCGRCAADVKARLVNRYTYDDEQGTLRVSLRRCTNCSAPFLIEDFSPDDEEWILAKQLYPPERPDRPWLPLALRRTIREAEHSFECGTFLACAIMCRRALDMLCHHFKGKGRNLDQKLKSLRSQNIIDETLAAWAEALRKDGNLAAHDPEPGIARDDAQYMLQFTQAMLDHIFVLRKGFDAYQARQKGRVAKRKK